MTGTSKAKRTGPTSKAKRTGPTNKAKRTGGKTAARKTTAVVSPLRLVWYAKPEHQAARRQDALGLRHLEERIADWFWPGFTSRSTRAGYYFVVLYGLRMADLAAAKFDLPRDDDTRRYLVGRFERVWGMSQFVATKGAIEKADQMLVNDALAATYAKSSTAIPINFLHTRQGEVGALGAYLPSLRAHRLVAPTSLRLTPLGLDLSQWMWDAPHNDQSAWDEFILKALDPRTHTIPTRVGRVDLKSVGDKGRLSRFAGRTQLCELVWRRLFSERPPPASLSVLPLMADHLKALHQSGITAPRDILNALAEHRTTGADPLQYPAKVALCLAELGTTMLRIFDRVHKMLLAEGYAADWSDCVQAAVTPDLVEILNTQMARYRDLKCNERIGDLSAGGRVFAQIMRRFNTQNPYNTFESILNLHTGSNRALSKGDGWIARVGETVYLRQASTEYGSSEVERWHPTFRMTSMTHLLEELGQLT